MTARVTGARATDDPELQVHDADGADGPAVLRFAGGIPGFPDATAFTLTDLTEDGTFQLLAAAEQDVSLVVASPWLFFPDYAPDLPDAALARLGIEAREDLVLFCAVQADDTDALHLNLRAPFVTNVHTHASAQLVLDDEDLPLRATVPAGG